MAKISTLIAFLSYAIALCGIVPLFPWLPDIPRYLLVAGLLAGIWQDVRGSWPLKNWLLNASLIPVFLYYAAQFSRSNIALPMVSLLAIVLAVRLLGEKNGRHYLQIYVLALFSLAASSLFDLSPVFLVYLGLMLFMVAVALVLLTFYAKDSRMVLPANDLRKVVAAGLVMPLASLPLLAFFFPLLPRTQFPLWNFLGAPVSRVSALSDKVEPGLSPIAEESRVVAFRAELPRQPDQQLYWRAIVFNRLDGNRWIRDASVPPERTVNGTNRISQTIFMEPSLLRFWVALDEPAFVSAPRTKRNPDNTFQPYEAIGKRQSYKAFSFNTGVLRVPDGIDRSFYLRLPRNIPPRISRMAEEIRLAGKSDGQRLAALEMHFQKGGYRYSMRGLPTGAHALEEFLFEKKQGHCEFFASAFALVLRAAGVPARIVGGYLGGEYSELGGYYLITENMAHVWVEAFIEGRGWLRIDPSSFAENSASLWDGAKRQSLWFKMSMLMDSLNYFWNRSVIQYDFTSQINAALAVGERLQEFKTRWIYIPGTVVVLWFLSLSAFAFLLRYRRRLFLSREQHALSLFYRTVERDCEMSIRQGKQGILEIAEATGNRKAKEFANIYAGAVYRDRRLTSEEYAKLKEIAKKGFGK